MLLKRFTLKIIMVSSNIKDKSIAKSMGSILVTEVLAFLKKYCSTNGIAILKTLDTI